MAHDESDHEDAVERRYKFLTDGGDQADDEDDDDSDAVSQDERVARVDRMADELEGAERQ